MKNNILMNMFAAAMANKVTSATAQARALDFRGLNVNPSGAAAIKRASTKRRNKEKYNGC